MASLSHLFALTWLCPVPRDEVDLAHTRLPSWLRHARDSCSQCALSLLLQLLVAPTVLKSVVPGWSLHLNETPFPGNYRGLGVLSYVGRKTFEEFCQGGVLVVGNSNKIPFLFAAHPCSDKFPGIFLLPRNFLATYTTNLRGWFRLFESMASNSAANFYTSYVKDCSYLDLQ